MKPKSALRSFLALVGSSLLVISSAHAQSQWTNTTTGTQQWNTAANWDTNPTVPNAIGAVANLSVNLGVAQTVNLATAVTLGSLTFGDSATAFFGQNISGSAITFNNGGSGATLTHSASTAGDVISANITLNDNLTMVNNGTIADRNNAVQLTGIISGNGGITINAGGNGAFYLINGGNTYSGGVTLNAANARIVPYYNGDAFGTGTITINAGTVDTSAPSGAALLLTTSNANVWNGNWTLANFWNNNGNVTLGNNITVTRNNHLSLGGNISETGGTRSLTLSSAASSVFNGTNTYTGGTTVSAGSLAFLKTASMPSTGNVSLANGTTLGIGLGGDGWTSTGTGAGTLAGIFQGTNVGVGPGSSTLSYTTAVGLNLIVTGSHSFGEISNLGSGATAFTMSGLGTLTMAGDNIYTGATTVQGGGGLVLDYGSSDTSKFASAAGLTLGGSANTSIGVYGGGTITVKGGTFTEIVSATSLNAGHTTIARDGGTTAKLRLNAITRAAGGTISFADATIADTDRTNTNGIIGGYATLGNDWAINSTNLGDGLITAPAAYDGVLPDNLGSATANYTLTGNLSLTAATAANTVKITNTGNSETLALGANNLTITSASATALGGLMYTGGADGNYAITGTGRIQASTASSELIFAVNSGTLSVSAVIGGSGSSSPLTKTGAGTLVINSAFTGSGNIFVNEGALRLNNAAASGAATGFGGLGTFIQNGAALELNGFTFTDAERLMLCGPGVSNGGALRAISGINIWRGLIEIAIGGARINNDSAGLLTLNRSVTTVPGGDITFGGVGNITVTTPTATTYGRQAINGGGGLIKDGAGTLTLSGANNYAGNTTVTSGTLDLPDNASLRFSLGSASGVNNNISGSGTVVLNGDFLIDTSTADSLSSGSWTLESVSTLTGAYGSTFTVIGFTDAGSDTWTKLVGGKTYTFVETTGILTLTSGGGPGPLDNFLISAISSPQTVGTPITGITLTARDASNATVTSFTGTVNFGGTGGFSGTSATFTAGVLSGVSVTPTNAGSGLTFTVTDIGTGKTGSATITTIQTQYQFWAGGALFNQDANNDGVSNGMAFLLGAAGPTSAVTQPTVTQSGGNLVLSNFSSRNLASRGTATLSVEHSSDLGIGDPWTTVLVPEATAAEVSGVSYNITPGSPLNTVNTATISVSQSAAGKLFGRLKANNP